MEINRSRKNAYCFLLNIESIKIRLGLQKKYSKFKDFKRRVLETAKTEIKTHSDLNIDFEEIHKGRKVEAIKFYVERKPGTKPASYAKSKNSLTLNKTIDPSKINHNKMLPQHNNENTTTKPIVIHHCDRTNNLAEEPKTAQDTHIEAAIEALSNLGVNYKQAIKYVDEYGTQAVIDATKKTIKASEKAANEGKTIDNVAAYVVKCLKNNSEALTLNSDDLNTQKQAEKDAKQQALIDRELRWIELDRWCTENKDLITPIIQKHISDDVITDYQDYLFLKECTTKVSDYMDIIDYPLLLTDVFLEVNNRQMCFNIKSFHKILIEMMGR